MRQKLARAQRPNLIVLLLSILGLALVGILLTQLSRASRVFVAAEPERGTPLNHTRIENDPTASNGQYVHFGPIIPYGKASPGGTYADWYYPGSSLSSIEWSIVPLYDPSITLRHDGLLHYYAYNFAVTNSTSQVGYGYAGFQTNGFFGGTGHGEVVNFSIWGSNGGLSPSPGMVNLANPESGGAQIMFPYPWSTQRAYRFQLKPGPHGTDSGGKWWGLWVTDTATHITTYLGEERVPVRIGGLDSSQLAPHTSAFGEDSHWWRSLDGSTKYVCADFQNSSMAFVELTANNGAVNPNNFTNYTNSGQTSVSQTNGYTTTNCTVTNYTDNRKNVQMNLGYWARPAANDLSRF